MKPCQPGKRPNTAPPMQPVVLQQPQTPRATAEWPARRLVQPTSLQRVLGDGDDGRWFALNGGRLYCVQTLTGMFPDTGWHQPGEMGGVWSPPIKLFDGYWLGLRSATGAHDDTHTGAHAGADVAMAGVAVSMTDSAEGADIIWLTQPDAWELTAEGAIHHYMAPALGLVVTRRAWIVPHESALVLDVFIAALGAHGPMLVRDVECGLVARSDLHGAWLAEEQLGLMDGDDVGAYDADLRAITLADTRHPDWSACVGAVGASPVARDVGPQVWGPQRTAGRGTGAALWYRLSPTEERPAHLRFLLTGPTGASAAATETFQAYAGSASACRRLDQAHREASARFQAPLTRCILRTSDATFDEMFAWTKANLAWLQLDIPGLGKAPMGGIADFPWWFGCDTEYGLLPMLAAGQGTEAGAALRTLAALSQRVNGNGRVLHEISSSGAVSDRGHLVETPLFTRALYATYRWTGDRALVRDLYPFCAQGLLRYTLGERREAGELVPQGRSMIETPEMHGNVQTLDVGAYTAEALEMLAELRDELGGELGGDAADVLAGAPDVLRTSAGMRSEAERLRGQLRAEWWLPQEDFFGDLRASEGELRGMLARFEALPAPDPSVLLSIARLRDALTMDEQRVEREPLERRRPWLLLHYVQALAAEAGLPTPEQAGRIFRRMATPEWMTEYGIVLNAITDRHVMSLPTGALATALARYGESDAALAAIQRLIAAFGKATPGTISEFSPDAGCFLQLWSSYGVIWPVVRYFFGLDPDVACHRLVCAPQLPSAWPLARLEAVPLGEALVDVRVGVTDDNLRVHLVISDPHWEVTLGAPGPASATAPTATLNGAPVTLERRQAAPADGRWLWLAPARRGAVAYELHVQWHTPTATSAADHDDLVNHTLLREQ
ncbi:MAG: hypothetical protein ABI068_07525 [Ktedonobacterales bacterium]